MQLSPSNSRIFSSPKRKSVLNELINNLSCHRSPRPPSLATTNMPSAYSGHSIYMYHTSCVLVCLHTIHAFSKSIHLAVCVSPSFCVEAECIPLYAYTFHCMHILHFTPTFNMRDKNQSHKEKKK